jgi:DNA-binding response OmpR family regulator
MRKIILLMDNYPPILDVLARLLELAGYQILRAPSLEEAEEQLKTKYIHLGIFDIRMEDDNDANDISGLVLARKDAYRSLPKIILTAHPTLELMHDALVVYQVVDFVAKDKGPTVLMQATEQVFTKYVHINWNLLIHFEEGDSFFYLVSKVDSDIQSDYLMERASELEGLFRTLFFDYTQITLGRLFASNQGRVLLEVFAYKNGHRAGQFVVSCGQKQAVQKEDQHYETLVPKVISKGSTGRQMMAETLHFAATAYTLIGIDCEEAMTFRAFYQNRPVEEILTCLDHLYKMELAQWHRSRFSSGVQTLSELCLNWLGLNGEKCTPEILEHHTKAICHETLAASLIPHLTYSSTERTFWLSDDIAAPYLDPVSRIREVQSIGSVSALCGVTHGRLDVDAVLVDSRAETWLTNFEQVGNWPLLCDFVLLETTIKVELLKGQDLHARYALEKQLLNSNELKVTLTTEEFSAELHNVFRIIERIRELAANLAGAELTSYLCALFFCTIRRLTAYDLGRSYTQRELIPYAHSLLIASMIYEKLIDIKQENIDLPDGVPDQAHAFWIDDIHKEVWVDGQKAANITSQDYNILAYLYKHANRPCPPQEIVDIALGGKYTEEEMDVEHNSGRRRPDDAIDRLRQKADLDAERRRIDNAIFRLRKKIGSKYIKTVRGHGFKLNINERST